MRKQSSSPTACYIRVHVGRFSLIELLVVIAIIMILAAMLLPALNRAKVQAKLTLCAAALQQNGLALFSYSNDFDSWYPYRSIRVVADNGQPFVIYTRNSSGSQVWDDRPLYRPYMDVDDWYCPFNRPVSGTSAETATSKTIYVSFEQWYGGGIVRSDPSNAIFRSGDRFSWGNRTFDVLAGDLDRGSIWVYITAHPDTPSTLIYSQVETSNSFALRYVNGIPSRGKLTKNMLMGDGAVLRLAALNETDGRVRKVEYDPFYTTNTYWGWLPPQ